MTYRQLLERGTHLLAEAGIEEAGLDAWYLMERATGINRTRYLMDQRLPAPEEGEAQYLDWIEQRTKRIPLQHILGDTEFMGLSFRVNRHVLVPRQDTETLVELVLETQESKGYNKHLLDMCTGSGCIAVSLACLGQFASVSAADISEKALEVARENALHNNAEVRFLQSDLFRALDGERYDIIVSNPPYIPSEDIEGLAPEVRDHDPRLALDGGADGLIFYRRLAKEGWDILNSGGLIFWEIGCEQAEDVSELLKAEGYMGIQVIQDLTGKDRVVRARKPDSQV